MGKKETSTEMSTIKPSDAKTYVEHCMKVNRPVFLWGSPGIGKSDIIQQIADEQGRKVIDMRLILMGPEDLKGIPYFNSNDGSMHWAPSSELPEVVTQEQVDVAKDTRDRHLNLLNLAKATDCLEDVSEEASRVQFIDETELKFKISDEKYGRLKGSLEFQDAILFLDEMNSAPQSVQGAAYQLTLDRKIGEYELPKGVSIICAGNHDSDKGHSHRMPTPLANRLIHLSLDVDFNDWQDWAITNGIHPDIVGYLTVSPMKLHNFDPSSKNKSFATPRSWEFVSDLLTEDMPQSMAKDLIAGTVGEGLAIEYPTQKHFC
jgi:MoxR-like ATPase